MAIETERFQVAMTGEGGSRTAILVDTATGRSWMCDRGNEWRPMAFNADAEPAPTPARAKPAAKPKPAGKASTAIGTPARRRVARAT